MANRSKKFLFISFALTFSLGLIFLTLFLPIVQAANVNVNGVVSEISGCDSDDECDEDSDCTDFEGQSCLATCVCEGGGPPPPPPARCGDGLVNQVQEQCDDGNNISGDGCSAACQIELPPECGNDQVEAGEECDDGLANSDTESDACRTNCQRAHCSDGVGDTGEACDDGNLIDGDGCDSNCTNTACGNNIVTPETGEACDDGNTDDGDGCSATCQIEIGCGDGVLDADGADDIIGTADDEGCDDGNLVSGDGCDSNCTNTACGNTIITPGTGEECDDGNTDSGDGCSATCLFELCGNGELDPGEACDDGNTDISDLCDTDGGAPNSRGRCTATFCSDGVTQVVRDEECDDGNLVSGDGCSASCLLESICGNNQVEEGEECDPPGFGCSETCQFVLVILTHEVTNITIDSATINWTTNLASLSVLDWEMAAGGEQGSVENLSGTDYSWPLAGLRPGTRYNYEIIATRANPPHDQDSRTGTFVTAIEELCGDGRCTGDETHETCPEDCIEACMPDWLPGDWGSCIDGVQTREYEDLNLCDPPLYWPPDQRCCLEGCDIACGICQDLDIETRSCIPIWPCCGDRICEEDENVENCPIDCGISPRLRITLTQCLDGLDNDGDGSVDYPADPGCASPADDSELNFLEILQNIQKFLESILDNPIVEQINKIATPILIATIALNTFATFSFFNFLSYLQFFVSQPLAALFRRKRRKWGIVYNSLGKQPIDLAIVRLYQKENARLVQSRVTDKLGRYNFLADPGRYYITVTKPKYTFPTEYLKDQKEDVKYLDIYHGETIEVTEQRANITLNIPVDPVEEVKPVAKVIFQYYLRKVQYAAAFSAVPLATISMIIDPGPLTFTLFGFHCLLFVLFRRLGYQKAPKSWGMVYDKTNRRPITRAITRIYDKQYNKLLETRVTDAKGRYSFLVNNNVYYLTTEKMGYRSFKSEDIDLVSKDREAVVGLDIGLEKGKVGERPETMPAPPAAPPTKPVVPPADKVGIPAKLEKPAPPSLPVKPEKPEVTPPEKPVEPPLTERIEDLEVDRKSLEELAKTKKEVKEIKKDIVEEKEELEKMEERVEEVEETIEEKLEKIEEEKPAPKPAPSVEAQKPVEPVKKSEPELTKEEPQEEKPEEKPKEEKQGPPPEKSIFG
jgi:cysteine-rich repeat protein